MAPLHQHFLKFGLTHSNMDRDFLVNSIQWHKPADTRLHRGVSMAGKALPIFGTRGLFNASIWRENDPHTPIGLSPERSACSACDLEVRLEHAEPVSAQSGSILKASLSITNVSAEPLALVAEYYTGLRPAPALSLEKLYFPLTALGTLPHPALAQLGVNHQVESLRNGPAPAERIAAHYLEPLGSEPGTLTTQVPLLIPLITQLNPQAPAAISLFASPEMPWAFIREGNEQGEFAWRIQTRVHLLAQESRTLEAFLSVHPPTPESAWPLFHQFCSPPGPETPAWLRKTKVHYFDFLSAASPGDARGDGFIADAAHFPLFHVGMATQHGYYPHWGDYIHPDRKTWHAMPGDIHGGSTLSLDDLRDRIALSRKQGARAAIYTHLVGFDDASPLWERLKTAGRIEADGSSPPFCWKGPDVAGTSRFMSIANPLWRNHLLQQARWIFELLDPDAIVVDESFGGIGYDYATGSPELSSPSAILFFRELRKIARSFGPDKAILTADCALSSFVLWADGEAGDHGYAQLLGHSEYRREPVRYLAALGNKPWLPCAWLWQQFWDEQRDLAKKTGSGIGVANGWLDFAGLAGLPDEARNGYRSDIEATFGTRR